MFAKHNVAPQHIDKQKIRDERSKFQSSYYNTFTLSTWVHFKMDVFHANTIKITNTVCPKNVYTLWILKTHTKINTE
jgi:hypothetical protein